MVPQGVRRPLGRLGDFGFADVPIVKVGQLGQVSGQLSFAPILNLICEQLPVQESGTVADGDHLLREAPVESLKRVRGEDLEEATLAARN